MAMNLKWKGQQNFKDAPKVDVAVAGAPAVQMKHSDLLTVFYVESAGHMVPTDQPAAAFFAMNSLLFGGNDPNAGSGSSSTGANVECECTTSTAAAATECPEAPTQVPCEVCTACPETTKAALASTTACPTATTAAATTCPPPPPPVDCEADKTQCPTCPAATPCPAATTDAVAACPPTPTCAACPTAAAASSCPACPTAAPCPNAPKCATCPELTTQTTKKCTTVKTGTVAADHGDYLNCLRDLSAKVRVATQATAMNAEAQTSNDKLTETIGGLGAFVVSAACVYAVAAVPAVLHSACKCAPIPPHRPQVPEDVLHTLYQHPLLEHVVL